MMLTMKLLELLYTHTQTHRQTYMICAQCKSEFGLSSIIKYDKIAITVFHTLQQRYQRGKIRGGLLFCVY